MSHLIFNPGGGGGFRAKTGNSHKIELFGKFHCAKSPLQCRTFLHTDEWHFSPRSEGRAAIRQCVCMGPRAPSNIHVCASKTKLFFNLWHRQCLLQ